MTIDDYESLLLTLREQYIDENTLDEIDIKYLFEIIDTLELKLIMYEDVIKNSRYMISN